MEGAAIFFLFFNFLCFHKIYGAELDSISGSRFLTDGDTLVSEKGIFELGFFRPEGSENRYLGIWFKKVSVRTVVWVANREHPLPGASQVVLKMVDPGILVISQNNSMVWSSNTTITPRNATARLHDTGNLVLTDQQEKVLWQSFDYPTDTSLYGMKIGKDYIRGIEWHLSSWKNSRDPAPGEFTWSVETDEKNGYPEEKLKQGSLVKFRGGFWNHEQVRSYAKDPRSSATTYNVIISEREVSYTYYSNSSIPSRVTLNSSGLLEASVWVEESKKWKLSIQVPTDICDTYNICSAYGSCVSVVPNSCVCLDEKRFVPRNQKDWEKADWSGGCVRRTKLDCKNGSEGFMMYPNVKLPDTDLEHAWFTTSMSMEDCKAECLKNCSCMAYGNPDIGSLTSACLLWFDDVIDTRLSSQSSGNIDLFVRMASSELVAQSTFKKKGGSNNKMILLVILPGVLLISIISAWLWYARIKRNHVQPTGEGGSLHVSKNEAEDIQLPMFSFSTIAAATASFSTDNIIGEGGFGPVYKGVLKGGLHIAVKRLSLTSDQGIDEFKNEVVCISRLQHRNLVKLLGCCINEDEKQLIYEYMPNKSLDSFIFDENRSMLLDWTKRFNIIKGIARGLLYLHHDSRLRIIHRDLKAGNILLDLDMNPKISDFGLARSFGGNETQANTKRVVGTHGYMSPEYVRDGLFSIKSDVFSYGVLVLEIVSGKRNRGFIHPDHDNNLIGHAWGFYNEGRTMDLIDANLVESCHFHEVLRSIEIGLLCVQEKAGDRPNMAYVVRMLDCEGTLPQPKQPAFFTGPMERGLLIGDSFSSINRAGSRFLTDGDTLVSETGNFELGFFRPEGSENRYLGIWFKKVSVRTVVWVANREHPLPGASPVVLKMIDPGILVISQNNSMVWSSNTTITSTNATAKLHDTGNLVLIDQQEKIFWQSFDYPTDTSLYGMKIGKDYSRGIEWYLSSWKNSRDPAPGEFTWSVETHEKHGYPEKKLKQGSVVIYRGGLWNSQQVSYYAKTTRSATTAFDVIISETEVSFSYEGNNSIPSRITMNSSGLLEVSRWEEDIKKWKLKFQIPTDICDTYNICGAYGSCNVSVVPNFCVCLDEKRFVPRNQKDWEKGDASGGCVRRTNLDCKNGSEGFYMYSNVKLPDTEHAWFNTSISMEDCKAECLKNCSCMAYANPWIGSQGACLLWFDELIDIRLSPQSSGGIDLFVKMASSELVPQLTFQKKRGSKIKVILLVIIPGALLISAISTWLWYAWIKRYHVQPSEEGRSFHVSKNKEEDIQLPLFSFSTIATATASFSTDNIIGEGGFGPVYKGVLEGGLHIAVKRLSLTSDQGVDEFKNEVICISRLQHRNLVKLLGCCINEDEKQLIYEYMPNNSLDSFIFDVNRSILLDWTKRFNIIKGIARGLLYLHHDSRLRIIHRDLKAGNILLDLDMNPKISDFGLARSFGGNETQANTKRVVGTHGYMSPEYVRDGIFSIKSDVFSYGVILLEIVSGKKNRGFIHPEHDNNLIGHAWSLYNEGRTMELIDVKLAESCHQSEVVRSIEVGLLCVQEKAGDRPNMAHVVWMLEGEGTLPQPKQPGFFTRRDLLMPESFSNINRAGSVNGLTFTQLDGR